MSFYQLSYKSVRHLLTSCQPKLLSSRRRILMLYLNAESEFFLFVFHNYSLPSEPKKLILGSSDLITLAQSSVAQSLLMSSGFLIFVRPLNSAVRRFFHFVSVKTFLKPLKSTVTFAITNKISLRNFIYVWLTLAQKSKSL